MLRNYYIEEKVHINFLYSNNGYIKKIKEEIIKNPINCEQEYFNKCIKIRNLFLKRINNGMNSTTYHSYKECFKYINTDTHLYIDNIITLLEQDDKTLIKLVNDEKNKYDYLSIYQYKKQKHLKNEDLLPPELAFSLLKDIYVRMVNVIREYVYKLASLEYFKHKEKNISYILDDEITYHVITTVLKEKIISEFSYLDDTLYSEIYQQLLNNLNQEFNKYLRKSYNYIYSYENRIKKDKAYQKIK